MPRPMRDVIVMVSSEATEQELHRFVDSVTCTYMVSVVAASVAELTTYPLDLCKTRLQIQGEGGSLPQPTQYRGMFATASGIVHEEGLFKLWQGMSPALYRHVIYSGVRICTYDYLRKELAKGYSEKEVVPFWKSGFCAIFSGCLAQWLASPADLVKVQIQMEGKRRLMGEKARVKSAADAFSKILQTGGITGLWKGSLPNVYRAAFVNLGDLTTYDTVKQILMKKLNLPDGRPVHIMSSVGAGLVAATLGTPADVIKTRVMNQPTDKDGRGILYKGSFDCLRKTIAKEGILALYKGFIPCWMRMAPWSLSFWISFEQIRKIIGASHY